MNLRLQRVQVATGSDDQESRLVYDDDFLVAVLVQLSDLHDAEAGKWVMEIGFGPVNDPHSPLFTDLCLAQDWISARLASRR